MAEALTTVGRYFWLHEALVASSLLEAAGIPSCLQDANLVRLNWMYATALQGIRLQVPITHANEARAVLSSEAATFEDMPSSDGCANCGAASCRLVHPGRRATFLTWLFLGVPLWYRRPVWKCDHCGATTRPPNADM